MNFSKPLHDEPMILSGRDVTAVLGPTNTGKTYYAIERMIAHESGVIGLPLRLLAREVYQRICERVGSGAVSLVTGEEKISPPNARYAVCTVEAMPQRTRAAFVAIDEVQLAGDLERGHIFTDRILHLRGQQETLLLGAGTMRGILQHLLPGLTVVERPRLSQLVYAGSKKITRLPRRSAIVAFSADEVYAIAELVRRQRGGAAVVMGALSPRTRNAQIALYQSGDVEYLVATDAIGMGLNLDVDHVAFAQDRKFDGYQFRPLNPGELGQVAGRAGRHVNDGTFGVTGRTAPLGDDVVERIETHEFDPVRVLQWRTTVQDFSSLEALRGSLDRVPALAGLTRALPAVDQQALDHLVRYREVSDLADTPERIEKLWETCALPDYRRITPAQHAELIGTIYGDLIRNGAVNEDFMAEQVGRANRTEGEIDTLSARVAQIRTWTYVSHRPGWLADPTHWQEKTREIEDRLSDALHERLTKRFVDRRTSVLMKRLRENAMLEAEIGVDGDVFVEGHHVGVLSGFRFVPDQNAEGSDAKAVLAAAQKALALELEARAARLHAAGNSDFAFGSDAIIRWRGDPVAKLVAGETALSPRIVLLADDHLAGSARDFVVQRIERFVRHHISTVLKPLEDLSQAEDLEGLAKGVAFQIVENLGIVFRRDIADDVKALGQDARGSLRRYGVRFGAYHIFLPALLKPAPADLVTLLWALQNDAFEKPGYGDLIAMLAAGRTSIVTDPAFERTFYKLAGYRYLGKRAVRIDILERLSDLIRPALQWNPGKGPRPEGGYDGRRFTTTPAMLSILGATQDDIEEILKGLGYRADSVVAEKAAAHIAAIDAAAPPTDADTATATPEKSETGTQSESGPHEAAPTASAAPEPQSQEAGPADTDPVHAEDSGSPAQGDDRETPDTSAPDASPGKPEKIDGDADGPAQDAEEPEKQSDDEPKAEEEPKPVLVWRPAGRDDAARGPSRRGRKDQAAGRQPAEKPGVKAHGKKGKGKKPGGRGAERNGAHPDARKDGGASHRGHQHARAKEKPVDPDSPFAKLAALKDQLKK